MTPATPTTRVPSIVVKPFKKVVPQEPWASEYAQNPFGIYLKERQDLKKTAPTRLRITKEALGSRRVQVVSNTPHPKLANGYKNKDLCQTLERKIL